MPDDNLVDTTASNQIPNQVVTPSSNQVNRFTSYNKDPPNLNDTKSYEQWLQLLTDWSHATTLPKDKQGPALRLSLSGEAREAALQIEDKIIYSEQGLDSIITKLKDLFIKDTSHRKYNLLEEFVNYKRKSDTNMQQYIIEFENKLFKTTKYGTKWPDDILAFWLLKNANLAEGQQQLTKACAEITYEDMKCKLIAIFGEAKNIPTADTSTLFPSEIINYTNDFNDDHDCFFVDENDQHVHSNDLNQDQNYHDCGEREFILDHNEQDNLCENTYITQNNRTNSFQPRFQNQYQNRFLQRPYNQSRFQQSFQPRRFNKPTRYVDTRYQYQNTPRFPNPNTRYNQPTYDFRINNQPRRFYTQQHRTMASSIQKTNPPSRCSICQSITHWASSCPHKDHQNITAHHTMYNDQTEPSL